MKAVLSVIIFSILVSFIFIASNINISVDDNIMEKSESIISKIIPIKTPYPLVTPPSSKTLPTNYHVFQTFNNCGPASLSMALSHYGVNITQQELGQELRPYQVSSGDNDDKSVTLTEMAEKAKDYGFTPYYRPGGNLEIIKYFISYDIPVITRTWIKENDDVGHYRVVKGYNTLNQTLIQDDSLQGKNLVYSYSEFNTIWKKFNYEYLVLVPKEKEEIAKAILGKNIDTKTAWSEAVNNSLKELSANPNDIYARFNLSVAYYNIGNYKNSVEEFEKVENQLPFRTLWYQIEPILAYYRLGQYDRVFEITDKILNNQNRAFSELYLIRSKIYEKQGNTTRSQEEKQTALFYNKNIDIDYLDL